MEGGEGGSGDDDQKGHHFGGRSLIKGDHFFEEKSRVTPSVTAPGDTNLSDATGRGLNASAFNTIISPQNDTTPMSALPAKILATRAMAAVTFSLPPHPV